VEKFHWLSKDEFDEKSGDFQVIRRTIFSSWSSSEIQRFLP
jgi:hypothetical protein